MRHVKIDQIIRDTLSPELTPGTGKLMDEGWREGRKIGEWKYKRNKESSVIFQVQSKIEW